MLIRSPVLISELSRETRVMNGQGRQTVHRGKGAWEMKGAGGWGRLEKISLKR